MIASSDQTSAAIPACPAPREAKPPRCAPPRRACDTHAHVFGPAARFPYAADRSYTPPDAPLAKYLGMLDTVGFARGVLVQGSAHGGDNAAMLDALAREPKRLRGIAVAGAGTSRPNCGAGTSSVCAGCGSTISFAAVRCIIAAAYRSTPRRCSPP